MRDHVRLFADDARIWERGKDAALPLPERFDLPSSTVQAIREAKQAGARVIAVAHAIEAGYRTHEFGDCTLVLTA